MLIYIEAITKQQLTNHINKQSLKPMGRWDITAKNAYEKIINFTNVPCCWYWNCKGILCYHFG